MRQFSLINLISEETSHLAEHARSTQSTNGAILQFEDLVRGCAHPEWNSDSALRVSLAGDSGKVFGERFRTLRSRLYQIAGTRTLRRVLITSSLPAEGKTFVATNLVRSIIRQADRRVLLIDADLRAPHLHVSLGAPSSPGLSDYLLGKADEYADRPKQRGKQSLFHSRADRKSQILVNCCWATE